MAHPSSSSFPQVYSTAHLLPISLTWQALPRQNSSKYVTRYHSTTISLPGIWYYAPIAFIDIINANDKKDITNLMFSETIFMKKICCLLYALSAKFGCIGQPFQLDQSSERSKFCVLIFFCGIRIIVSPLLCLFAPDYWTQRQLIFRLCKICWTWCTCTCNRPMHHQCVFFVYQAVPGVA